MRFGAKKNLPAQILAVAMDEDHAKLKRPGPQIVADAGDDFRFAMAAGRGDQAFGKAHKKQPGVPMGIVDHPPEHPGAGYMGWAGPELLPWSPFSVADPCNFDPGRGAHRIKKPPGRDHRRDQEFERRQHARDGRADLVTQW